LRSSKYAMCCGRATPELRSVLDVINPASISLPLAEGSITAQDHTKEKRCEVLKLLCRSR